MVNRAEPRPREAEHAHAAQACESSAASLLSQSKYLVFDHFHTDLQAFSTDVADDLVLVSEFRHLRHQIGPHGEADLLRAVFFDRLERNNASAAFELLLAVLL